MDQAGYHKEREIVQPCMKENELECIFNVAYRFQYNPCERMWSLIKHNYRQLLLDLML